MVEALLATLEQEVAVGEVFNIGNARSVVTIYELAQRVRRLTGEQVGIVFRPLDYIDVEMRIPNVDKARKLLGWEAHVELDEGLARTIAWYRARARALTK
jgi:nucleoside-diphosphate-sugar epimerase